MLFTSLSFSSSVGGVYMVSWVVSQFTALIERLDGTDMSGVTGFSISFWHLALSLFVIGTIINLITGSDDDI